MRKIHGGDIYSYNKNMMDFSANINPLGVTKNIIDAIINSVHYISNYPDIECRKLRKAIAETYNINMNYIICGNGAAELIFNIVLAIKPKKVLLIAPSFFEYQQAIDSIGSKKIYYFLKESQNFDIYDDILDYIDDSIDLLFLCNPNNPTGRLIKNELLFKIIDKCKIYGVFLVIDECFMDFVIDSDNYSLINYIDRYDNILLIKAFTKMYAIPGIRLGYCMSKNNSIIEKIYESRQPWNVSIIAQAAGIAALSEKEFINKTKKFIENEKLYILNGFDRLNIKYFYSFTNYILFKEKMGLDEKFLKYNFIIRNCNNYIGLGDGFYRIAIKKHFDNQKFLSVFKQILSEI